MGEPTDDLLSIATDALRDTPTDADGLATRLRVRSSLEASHRGRRQLAGFLTGTGILFAGTVSWAFATGRAEAVWRAIVEPARVEAPSEPPTPTPAPAPAPPRRLAVPDVPPPVEEPVVPAPPAPPPPIEAPAPPPAPPPPPVKAPPRAATVRPQIEALYRRAHDLHFQGADHAAAIAAWDAYLAAEPTGRFVAEARYNRALLLVRLGRYAEARAALAPYARGEIAGGYRRAEAARIVERLPAQDGPSGEGSGS